MEIWGANGTAKLRVYGRTARRQNANYRNRELETTNERMTTRQASGKRKNRETADEEHGAIIGLNTDQPDLYGLIPGDDALISRL
jgi:hypothetical protein